MLKSILTALALLLGAGTTHGQNLLLNGSFEAVDASASPFFIRSLSSTPGWTQILDGVDLIHNTYSQTPTVLLEAHDGVQFLDMNQFSVLGGIEQVVTATPGFLYRLDLVAAAWAENSIGGTIGYQLYDPDSMDVLATGSFTDSVGGVWTGRALEAAAISSQMGVRIQGLAATQAGMGLDDVRLTAVPEPSVAALGGLALMLGSLRFMIRNLRRNGARS